MKTTLRRLVLWDIDGTLLRAGDIGAAVFDLAVEEALGIRPSERVRMSGKTDPQIVAETLALLGVDRDPDLEARILRGIEDQLAAAAAAGELATSGRACPGVPELLEALDGTEGVLSGLLTGNVRANAMVKVGAFGLDRWLELEVGAFGSDHHDRNCLVPVALDRLEAGTGVRLDPQDVWVVGDTPRDLDCARAGGARCLLVATGRYTLEELQEVGADRVLADLTATEDILALLTAGI